MILWVVLNTIGPSIHGRILKMSWIKIILVSTLCMVLLDSGVAYAGLPKVSPPQDVPVESFVPDVHVQDSSCATRVGQVRALLIGVDKYPNNADSDLKGPSNDVGLLKNALLQHSVTVTTLVNPTRHDIVVKLASAAAQSQCGDTIFVFFSGHGYSREGELFFLASDLINVSSDDFKFDNYEARPVPNTHDGRRMCPLPGAIDARELGAYFDHVRDNGVNVFFAADSGDSMTFRFTLRDSNIFWHGAPDHALDTPPDNLRGAYFGIYTELSLENHDILPHKTKTVGLLSYAMSAALSESGNKSFRDYAREIVELMQAPNRKGVSLPTFEASDITRSPFATGLRSGATTRGALLSTETRRIDITAPTLQRGLGRVGLGNVLLQGRVIAPEPPKSINANQVAGRVFSDGSFQISLPVVEGPNTIALAAWWSEVDMVSQGITVLSQAQNNVLVQGKRYALIIANQDYHDSEFPPLGTPAADGRALAELLKERFGFITEASIAGKPVSFVLINATRSQMVHAFSEIHQIAGGDDSVLIYYGGHGVYEKETDRAYWLPVDALASEPGDWYSDQDLAAEIARLNAKHVLVVADSCFSGAFRTRGAPARTPDMSRIQFLDQVSTRASRNLLTSGGKEPVADGGGRGHSIFAQALLDGLQQDSQPFTAGELFENHIKKSVGGRASQIPQYFPMREGDDGGEFVFFPVSH
jgi:uncharacterized caspase-like protein